MLETDKIEPVIISASGDHNIHVHLLANGVFIGQFGQRNLWDIYDLNKYFDMKPKKYIPPKTKKKKKVRIMDASSVLSPGGKSLAGKSATSI